MKPRRIKAFNSVTSSLELSSAVIELIVVRGKSERGKIKSRARKSSDSIAEVMRPADRAGAGRHVH